MIKVRGVLGPDRWDDKEVTILGRKVGWGEEGRRYEADERLRELVLEYSRFNGGTRALKVNGDKDEGEWVKEASGKEEAKVGA